MICINKWDINPEISEQIKIEASANGATFVGCISYDHAMTLAQINERTLIEESVGLASTEVKKIWKTVHSILSLKLERQI